MLIPQFCEPVWWWAMEVAGIFGAGRPPRAKWTAPPMPMIEPDKEGLAYQRNIRTGIMTLSEAIRERGYDPDEVFAEMAADNKKIDQLELVLDSDPRNTTQAGLPRVQQPPAAPADGKGSKDDGEGDDGPSKPENPPDDDDDDEDEDE
jgi:capsid protein